MMTRLKIKSKVLILSVLLLIPLDSTSRTIVLCPDSDLQKQLIYDNVTYLIQNEFNLDGQTIYLPNKSVLSFFGNGQFFNGTICGNQSKINAKQRLILNNIQVEGTWNNEIVFSEWVNLNENSGSCNFAFSCLMKLCEGNTFTHFYMQEGIYYVEALYRSAPILLPSNVYWHNKATIKMLPNDLDWYNIVYINKSDNVTIDGGSFVGDALNHIGNTGEWGHGIKCGGATNITLKNLICSYCWGDGIDLIEGLDDDNKPSINCKSISVYNVKCLYNRRQGMSIEAASDVKVSNSEFAYTGQIKQTPPSAGIDIEPWTNNCNKVWNLSFQNCIMHSNKGYDVQISGNYLKRNDRLNNNFRFIRCTIDSMLVVRTNGVFINRSTISQELKILKTKNAKLKESAISKLSKGIDVSNFHFIK